MATADSNDAKRVCCRVNNIHFFQEAGGMKTLALLCSDLKSQKTPRKNVRETYSPGRFQFVFVLLYGNIPTLSYHVRTDTLRPLSVLLVQIKLLIRTYYAILD